MRWDGGVSQRVRHWEEVNGEYWPLGGNCGGGYL